MEMPKNKQVDKNNCLKKSVNSERINHKKILAVDFASTIKH